MGRHLVVLPGRGEISNQVKTDCLSCEGLRLHAALVLYMCGN